MTLNIYQKISIVLTLIVFVLLTYDVLFHGLFELLHVLFESVEYTLDLIIEHFFATGTHETQVIVFYILVPAIFYGLYLLFRFFCNLYYKVKYYFRQQKIETLMQWHALSLLEKTAWWCFLVIVTGGGLFLGLF